MVVGDIFANTESINLWLLIFSYGYQNYVISLAKLNPLEEP